MRYCFLLLGLLSLFFYPMFAVSADLPVSEATTECLDCHSATHPGIVSGWQKSRHAQITPKQAMAVEGPALKVSSKNVSSNLQSVVVGCAECHLLRPEAHADTFEHNGYDVHIVVSPGDGLAEYDHDVVG